MYSFPNCEPVHCFMSDSNYCFLTCIQVSQDVDKVVWYSHLFKNAIYISRGSPGVLVLKNQPVNAGDAGDMDFLPESGRALGGGHDNSLQYSCLENPMDRGTLQVKVYGVAQNHT